MVTLYNIDLVTMVTL